MKLRQATSGPTVWLLDGPMPILKSSKVEVVIGRSSDVSDASEWALLWLQPLHAEPVLHPAPLFVGSPSCCPRARSPLGSVDIAKSSMSIMVSAMAMERVFGARSWSCFSPEL